MVNSFWLICAIENERRDSSCERKKERKKQTKTEMALNKLICQVFFFVSLSAQ
jgi:hypothetical protein